MITAEEWQRKREEHANPAMDWVRSKPAPCDWGEFFRQVNLALYGGFPRLFTAEAPQPDENWADKDPQEVFKLCEPVGKEDSMPEVLNNLVKWLARWIQRVIPDRKMMMDALAIAEAALLHDARKNYLF